MPILNKSQRHETRGKGQQRFRFLPFAFCLLPLASVAHAQNAQSLVSQMQQAEKTASYSAVQKGQGGTARIYRSGLKRRVEWLSPEVRRGDVSVDDGEHVTLYHRAEKSATQTDSRAGARPFAPLGAATKTQFAGRSAFLVPVVGGRTVVIDAQSKILLSNGANGFSLSGIRFGPVPAAKFAFVAPAGIQVQKLPGALYVAPGLAKRAARWLKLPVQLPPGWKFESAIVGNNSAWLRYSNKQSRFSLFEQPTTERDLAPHKVEGGGTFWKSGGVRILATGIQGNALDQLVGNLK